MSQADVISIMRDAVYTVILSAAPMLLVAIVIGLIVSIFQATTQINEQTLAFVPKIVGVMLALVFFGGFIFNTIEGFTHRLYDSIGTFIR